MESVTYDCVSHTFIFSTDDVMISIDMTGCKCVGDLHNDDQVSFETSFGRYMINTSGWFVKEHNSYSIGVVATTRVSNPIEFSIQIKTDVGRKQFEQSFQSYLDDYIANDLGEIVDVY